MPRTDVARAVNVTIDPVATYHVDPRGWRLFRALAAAIATPLNGRSGQHVYAAPAMFHGYAASPQRFTGAANLGAARTVSPRASSFTAEKEQSPLNSTVATIFAERMRRGRR